MGVPDIVPILEFFQDPVVAAKVDDLVEAGRQLTFTNGNITVDWGILVAAGALALLALGALLYFLFAAQDGDTGGSGYGYGYETQDYGYGDSYAHSRQVRSQGASFSDVSNMMTNLLSSGSSPVASHAKEGLQALANSWSNTAGNIANNLVN